MSLDQELHHDSAEGLAEALGLPPELVELHDTYGAQLLPLLRSLLKGSADRLDAAIEGYIRSHRDCEKTYVDVLRAFGRFMVQRWSGTPRDTWTVGRVKHADVQDFVVRTLADGRPRAATTSNKDLAIIRTFLTWLVIRERLTINPAEQIKRRREPESLPVALNAAEQQLLLNLSLESREGVRNYTMIYLVLNTGLRASEVCSLTWPDFDFKTGWLRFVGKGSKERAVPLLKSVVAQVLYYRDTYWRHQLFAPNARDHVFRNSGGPHWGMPMTTDGAEKMIEPFMKKLNKPKGQKLHVLRHTFAVNLLLAGLPLVYIKRLLGHSLLETTGTYTKVADMELARVMAEHFPKGVIVPRSAGFDFNPELHKMVREIMKEE